MSIVPDREKTDLQLICDATAQGQTPDPDLVKRIRDRSQSLRRKLAKELSVELVRDARNEE